jgi:hypothetical protein
MSRNIQIAQPAPGSIVVSRELPSTSGTSIGLPLVFQPQLYPALVMTLPSSNLVALKSNERSENMGIGHPLSSWSRLVSNNLVPRVGGASLFPTSPQQPVPCLQISTLFPEEPQINPRLPAAYIARALARAMQLDRIGAREDLNKAMELGPSPELQTRIRALLQKLGD